MFPCTRTHRFAARTASTVDFLTKKFKKNEGEVPQYYVEASHEPIIAPEEFDLVQAELKRRRQAPYRSANVLCSRLVCAACGNFYGPKVWHSNDKYRHIVWRCNAKFKGDKKCPSPVLREEQIKGMFMVAYDALTSSRTQIAADTRAMVAKLTDCTQIDGQITEAEQVLDEVSVLIRAAIHDHAQQAGDQTAFNKRYGELEARYTAMQEHPDYRPGMNYAKLGFEPCFLVFDEYVAFMTMLNKKENETVTGYIQAIILKGREAGFFLILACQRPDAKFLGEGVRDQFGFRVTLGKMSNSGYTMMFGSVDKIFMPKTVKGRGYVNTGDDVVTEFYSPLVEDGHDFFAEIGRAYAQAHSGAGQTAKDKGAQRNAPETEAAVM